MERNHTRACWSSMRRAAVEVRLSPHKLFVRRHRSQAACAWLLVRAWRCGHKPAVGASAGVRLRPGHGLGAIPAPLWEGGVEVVQAEPVQASDFYQLLASEGDSAAPDGKSDSGTPANNSASHQDAADGGSQERPEHRGEEAACEEQGAEGVDAMDAAAEALDRGAGPQHFADFFKAVLHPRSVVEVPLLPLAANSRSGFGDLAASAEEARRVRAIVACLGGRASYVSSRPASSVSDLDSLLV